MDGDHVSQREILFGGSRGGGGFGFGDGGGSGLLLGLLLARGGLFGDRRDGAPALDVTNLIQAKLGDIQAAIPLAASQVENAILSQTNAISAGIAGVKDAVQNGAVVTLTTANQTQNVVQADGEKTRALIQSINDANLQRELTVAQSALAEERGARRVREVEVNVSQVVSQAQAQQQQQQQLQAQFGQLFALLNGIGNQIMVARQAQDIVNLGTMTASGTQAAANTQVR